MIVTNRGWSADTYGTSPPSRVDSNPDRTHPGSVAIASQVIVRVGLFETEPWTTTTPDGGATARLSATVNANAAMVARPHAIARYGRSRPVADATTCIDIGDLPGHERIR